MTLLVAELMSALVFHSELYKACRQGSLVSLNVLAPDSNYLNVVLKTSVGVESKATLKAQGQFDTRNKELVTALD